MNCPICGEEVESVKDYDGIDYFQCESCDWNDKWEREEDSYFPA